MTLYFQRLFILFTDFFERTERVQLPLYLPWCSAYLSQCAYAILICLSNNSDKTWKMSLLVLLRFERMTHFSSPFPHQLSFLEEKAVNMLSECWGLALFRTRPLLSMTWVHVFITSEKNPLFSAVWEWGHVFLFEMILHRAQAWHQITVNYIMKFTNFSIFFQSF